mgnify:CR=1 FL=1
MGYYTTAEIVKIVNRLIDRCGTRDPYKVAQEQIGRASCRERVTNKVVGVT